MPTELGITITGLLVENFPDLLNVQFTAQLEDKLDQIEAGRFDWVDTLQDFYDSFQGDLKRATEKMRGIRKEVEETDEVCGKCGSGMVIRWGTVRAFHGLLGFPEVQEHRRTSIARERRCADNPAAEDGNVLRQMRQADGGAARTIRGISGVHRLSRMQDDAPARRGGHGLPRGRLRRHCRAAALEARPHVLRL